MGLYSLHIRCVILLLLIEFSQTCFNKESNQNTGRGKDETSSDFSKLHGIKEGIIEKTVEKIIEAIAQKLGMWFLSV